MSSAGQQASDTAVGGVIARPPFLYLACLLLGLALDRVLALPVALPEAILIQWTAGGGLILIGVAIVTAGIRNFSRAATPVPSNQPVRALVTTGIHGWSRNPIYVGMFLLLAVVQAAGLVFAQANAPKVQSTTN
jgi:protein-S-isoprenylcysteine O-methyltransferase Ste14